MSSYRDHHQNFNFRNALAPFAQDQDLPLAEVLSEADVVRIFAEEKVSFGKLAHSFWTPAITLWAFLWQVLSPDKSCRQVVANVIHVFRRPQSCLVRKGRMTVPLGTTTDLALLAGLPWGSIATVHSAGDKLHRIVGPASWQTDKWALPVLSF